MPYKHAVTGEIEKEQPKPYRVNFAGAVCLNCNKPLQRGEIYAWARNKSGKKYHQWCDNPRQSPWQYISTAHAGLLDAESNGSSNGSSNGASQKTEDKRCSDCIDHGDSIEQCAYTDLERICRNCGMTAGKHAGDYPHGCRTEKSFSKEYFFNRSKVEEQTEETSEEQTTNTEGENTSMDDTGALSVLAKALEQHLDLSKAKFDAGKLFADFQAKFDKLAEEFRESQKTIKVVNVTITNELGETKDAGLQHKLFPKLVKMLAARDHKGHRLNVWIAGPAGTGKTSAAEHAAKALGLDFSSTGVLTESYKIFGFMSPGTGTYVPTPFRRIWENGGVFLFDDCDASDPNVLTEFNNALANGGCTFPDGYIPRHADCVIVLTANTWGLGATNDYVGRMKQDAAFLDRFVKLYWPIDENLELATAPVEAWTRRVQQVRERCKEKGLKVLVTPRASYYGAALLQSGLSQSEVEEATLKGAMTDDQWRSVN